MKRMGWMMYITGLEVIILVVTSGQEPGQEQEYH